MILLRWRSTTATVCALLLALLLLIACGESASHTTQIPKKPTPTPSPTVAPGQQLLNKIAGELKAARTLHGIFNLTLTGQTINGTLDTEIWNEAPNKNRSEVLQSTITQFASAGYVSVTDGTQQWLYDPIQNVVYNGPATTATNGASPVGLAGGQGGQNQFLLSIVENIFTQSSAKLVSSEANVNGHSAYDIYVVSQGTGGFSYKGDIYVDKATQLPTRVTLDTQTLGIILLDLPTLTLNQDIPASTFSFVAPAGAKTLPLQSATATATSGDMITLYQAQQQAGYHLLSIPAAQTDYTLNGVTVLGSPGSQTFTLNYMKGNTSFVIAEGKSLANLPASGQSIKLRGTTATLSSSNGTTTLSWTEQGIGLQITGPLSKEQTTAIASSLT